MGNKPSASLSGVALAETAKLDDFPAKYPSAFKALTSDAYVDNIFITAADHETLRSKIAEVEHVAKQGGFYFKPFIVSGERVSDVMVGVTASDECTDSSEKALGLYWHVEKDLLYVKADFQKPSKNKRGCKTVEVSMDPTLSVRVLPHLTLRACLSLHARPFDALGFILPTRVIGNILFRNMLQLLKKERKGKIPWDDIITGELKEK